MVYDLEVPLYNYLVTGVPVVARQVKDPALPQTAV